MDRSKLERIVTHFQACARGCLLRNEVRRAREDFEDIVKEIDGGLDRLKWDQKTLCFPHFTDIKDAISPYKSPTSNLEHPKSEPRDCSSTAADQGLNREEDGGGGGDGLLEKLEAERDVSETNAFTSEPQDFLNNGVQKVITDTPNEGDFSFREKVMGSACDSTTVWGSVDTDMDSCHSVKGLRQYCLARDVPRTPEALRGHRNTLSMELLWLQQAIESRKKYLSLKNKLSGS